ncbi:hypothetical protein BCR44DRAFT_1426467 [Catenaria anguillulae PL171]|uniref:JmjC domain-containing protein n=1 Tax=Catenaria anguillulae PL171 TaxID=765915 RepID=A0A1Y2I0A0_9FUNG|nr:hypothetical protein BCR44DRAFT_1426467 [Catenaria anguillulae PL171]
MDSAHDMLAQPSPASDAYARDHSSTGKPTFPRLDAATLTYSTFVREHFIPNLPAIISSELTSSWRARREWVVQHTDGSLGPNLDRIQQLFGHAKADVADCLTRWYSDQEKTEMSVSEFVECWRRRLHASPGKDEDEWLGYLKDWHFVREFGAEYTAYDVPEVFKDDWLNLWYDNRTDTSDDYRFVYMGCKGTWTPFHADVLRSYSWSSNICGRKRWLFFPPGQEHLFTDSFGDHVYSVQGPIDAKRFPRFDEAVSIEVIQEAGETVFVPSGWFHQVWNLEDTISINHNWANCFNWDFVVQSVLDELAKIQQSIGHVRDTMSDQEWHDHCQLMLRSLAGIDSAGVRQWAEAVAKPVVTLDMLANFQGNEDEFSELLTRFEQGMLIRTRK